ncbi:hypothetical protein [Pseudothermotoga sp.]
MRVFIVTVGRSYLTNLEKEFQEKLLDVCAKETSESYKAYLKSYLNLKAKRDEHELIRLLEEVRQTEKLNIHRDSAEISTLNNLCEAKILDKKSDRIVLLHNKALGKLCEELEKELRRMGFEKVESRECDYRIEDLDSFKNLWIKLRDLYKRYADEKMEVAIVSTGGYKLITSLVYIFSLIYRVRAFYHHEGTERVYDLPRLPVNWDYVSLVLQSPRLMGLSSLVQAIFEVEDLNDIKKRIVYGEPVFERWPAGSYQNVLIKNLPTWQNLWIGDLIPETVEHSKSHSKRLLQRFDILLSSEIGERFFERLTLQGEEKEKFLFYFYASAYLHDIGHTVFRAETYDFSELPEVIRAFHNVLTVWALENWKDLLGLSELGPDDLTALKLISLYHRKKMGLTHVTHERSNSYKASESFGEKLLRTLIGWRNVPLVENEAFRKLDKSTQRIVLQVAALLKFLDELDVQADRVVDDNYMKVRLYRTKMESEHIIEKIERSNVPGEFKDLVQNIKSTLKQITLSQIESLDGSSLRELGKFTSLCKHYNVHDRVYEHLLHSNFDSSSLPEYLKLVSKLMFKIVQFDHFRKHASVQAIVPVWDEAGLTVRVYTEHGDELVSDEAGIADCEQEIKKQMDLLSKDQEVLRQSQEFADFDLLAFEFSDAKVEIVKGG